jgi:hypothetical protein
MQITVDISEGIRHEAEAQGIPLIEFVESLIARGLEVMPARASVSSAIERIRALQLSFSVAKR